MSILRVLLVALVLVIVLGAVLRVVVAADVVAVAGGVLAILAFASSHPVQPRIFASAAAYQVRILGFRFDGF